MFDDVQCGWSGAKPLMEQRGWGVGGGTFQLCKNSVSHLSSIAIVDACIIIIVHACIVSCRATMDIVNACIVSCRAHVSRNLGQWVKGRGGEAFQEAVGSRAPSLLVVPVVLVQRQAAYLGQVNFGIEEWVLPSLSVRPHFVFHLFI